MSKMSIQLYSRYLIRWKKKSCCVVNVESQPESLIEHLAKDPVSPGITGEDNSSV